MHLIPIMLRNNVGLRKLISDVTLIEIAIFYKNQIEIAILVHIPAIFPATL